MASLKKLIAQFSHIGLNISRMSPEEHDKYMSYVQALTHFVFLSFFNVLKNSHQKLEELIKVKTPPFQFLLAFSSRLLMGAPSTYASIQNTEFAKQVREMLLDSASNLHKIFSKDSLKESEIAIKSIRDPFSGTSLDEFSQFSLTSVSAVQDRERYFFDIMFKKCIAIFRTHGSDIFKVGFIRNIDSTHVYMDKILTRKEINGKKLVPMPINEVSMAEYKKDGINIKIEENIKIKKGNLNILARDKSDEWINKNILSVRRNLTFVNPANLTEEVFEEWIPMFISSIVKCEFVASYKKRGELPKVQLSLSLVPTVSMTEIERSIRSFCYGYSPSVSVINPAIKHSAY